MRQPSPWLVLCLLPLLAGAAAAPVPDPPRHDPGLAIVHVTLIDATGAPPRPDSTVVVTAGRIAAVGPSVRVHPPAGSRVIDGSGKFLIPGLWDMHVHLSEAERSLPLFVAEGVTGVRDMGGRLDERFRWRSETASGARLGPRIVLAGPILDGPEPADPDHAIAIRNPEEGRAAVRAQKAQGADFVKVYDGLSRETYFAIVAEARRLGLPVTGHVPEALSLPEVSDAGQRSVEHLGGIFEASSTVEDELRRARDEPLPAGGDFTAIPARLAKRGTRMLATYSPERAQRVFSRLVANQTWQVPTLVTKRVLAEIDDIARADDPRLRYVTAAEREWWSPAKNFFARYRTPAYIVWRQEMYRREVAMAGSMRRAGVPLLAGTDFISAYIFPGFSLHDELALLVEGGLTPMEALQAATLGPARFLGEERRMGTIQKGKVADLVLLDADPLADIHNTQRIDSVVLHGRYLGREERERLFAAAAAVAAAARPAG